METTLRTVVERYYGKGRTITVNGTVVDSDINVIVYRITLYGAGNLRTANRKDVPVMYFSHEGKEYKTYLFARGCEFSGYEDAPKLALPPRTPAKAEVRVFLSGEEEFPRLNNSVAIKPS